MQQAFPGIEICQETKVMTTKDKFVQNKHHRITGRIFIVPIENAFFYAPSHDPAFSYFTIDDDLQYFSFCDDFGPMNLACVFKFCDILSGKLGTDQTPANPNAAKNVALCSPVDKRSMTNAVFLLGAYLIMKLHWKPAAVEQAFFSLSNLLTPFRDVSPGPANFSLHLRDCWNGVWTAKRVGWVSFEDGWFSLEDYEHCDNPFNADLHEVVRGKFVAMRGPKSLPGGATYCDRPSGARDFSPAHYADILRQFDVEVVVRLNESDYEDKEFEEEGITVFSLAFPDCTPPPPDIVAKFLTVAEAVPGALAVHCKAGLGRTGTLIALYMMKHHGFTARAAMGWLRVVRPGSVIGEQQLFLCDMEAEMHAAGRLFRARARGKDAGEVASPNISGDSSRDTQTPLRLSAPSGSAPSANVEAGSALSAFVAEGWVARDRRRAAASRASPGHRHGLQIPAS